MEKSQFAKLVEAGYDRVPVVAEVFADLETPLSTYLKLADKPNTYLFESVQGGEKWGRYSVIGLSAEKMIAVNGHAITITSPDDHSETIDVDDPLEWLASYRDHYNIPSFDDLPGVDGRFNGGLVGFFSYDTVRFIEPKLSSTADHQTDLLKTPDMLFMESNEYVLFDNLRGRLYIVLLVEPTLAAYDEAIKKIESLLIQLKLPVKAEHLDSLHGDSQQNIESSFETTFQKPDFYKAVEKIKSYIKEGDVMQVVLSQRLMCDYNAHPIQLYRALRTLNPSPYLFYLNFSDFFVVGSSPEILVRKEEDKVTVRPLAGTRQRGLSEAEDKALAEDLLNDPKECAEHLMLIDLGRNDIGRVAKAGTVDVTEQMTIERYSHVMHIVSNVTGQLRDGLTSLDVLKATFPAGTLSGAPKVRAMEIIDELEPVRRGIYGGAVGYLAYNDNMDVAIAIRTAVIKDCQLHLQVGAGVVADSIAENEWQETLNKARALFRSVAMTKESKT